MPRMPAVNFGESSGIEPFELLSDQHRHVRSHDRDLDVLNRWHRIEQAVPLLTAIPPDPQLTGRRAKVQCRCLEPVDIHRVAQYSEVALLLRQPVCRQCCKN
jgi:hypothetical protein